VINTCGFVEDAKDESIEVRRVLALGWADRWPGCGFCGLARLACRVLRSRCRGVDLAADPPRPAPQTIIEAARLKQEGRVKKVVVTGCLAQRYSEELAAQLPEADLVIG